MKAGTVEKDLYLISSVPGISSCAFRPVRIVSVSLAKD